MSPRGLASRHFGLSQMRSRQITLGYLLRAESTGRESRGGTAC